jgi:biopolymer transport protein ExbB
MRKQLAIVVFAVLLGTGAGLAAFAQEAAGTNASAAPALRVESTQTLWKLIKSGGWAMWPLGACSVLTVTLTVLNFQRVSVKKMVPPVTVAQMKGAANSGDLQQLWNLASTTDTLFTRSMAAGLRHLQPDDPVGSRPKVEAAISETAGREEAKYAFFVNFLALLTSMSPMWGLIGTVSGMIGAFTKIGAGGMGKPEMLAKNIGEALVCTATGLIIAITAMAFYFLFRNILNTVMKESEASFSEILDTLMGMGNTFSPAPAPAEEPAADQNRPA